MSFRQRWYRNEKGDFVAGFQSFLDADEFGQVLERHRRRWGNRETDATWSRGSPYRGLEPLDVAHAAILFGQRRKIERARARLIAAAEISTIRPTISDLA